LIYDEHGNEHVWDIRIFQNKEVKKCVKYETGIGKIIDYRCSICNITKSDVNKLDDVVISKILLRKTRNAAILAYLLNSCPEGNMHNIVDKKCTKCEYLFTNPDPLSNDVERYVIKYLNFYNTLITIVDNKKVYTQYENIIDYTWEYNEFSLIHIAELSGISHFLLKAIGSMESLSEDVIIKNGDRLPYPDTLQNIQIRKIYSYVLLLMSEYNRLRNVVNSTQQSEYIKLSAMLIDEKIPEDTWYKLHEKLPKLQDTYLNIIKTFQQKNANNPMNIYLFICNMFFDILKEISNSKIGILFVITFIKKTVQQELSLTQHGEYNKALFLRTREALLSDDTNLDYHPVNDDDDDAEYNAQTSQPAENFSFVSK
jgi:hypothetical protein